MLLDWVACVKVMGCFSVILNGLLNLGVILRVISDVFIEGGLNVTSMTAQELHAWPATESNT